MKRTLILIFTFAIVFSCVISVSAADKYVNDSAKLLSESELSKIEELCANASGMYGYDIAVLTVQTTNGKSISRFADDYYDNSGYLSDGLVLVIDIGEREVYISTSGNATRAFSDAYLDKMIRNMQTDLTLGDYFDACSTFVDDAEYGIVKYINKGTSSGDRTVAIVIAIIIGIIIALIIMMSHVKRLKTVSMKKNAMSYIRSDSERITQHRDMFLYSSMSRTPKPKQSSGGSTHRSSSGNVHGGRGGRF